MATDSSRVGASSATGYAATLLGVGGLAALGSILVALGLTDALAYAGGYRPGHWVGRLYAQAFLVTGAGWTLLAAAAVSTLRTALAVR